MSQPFDLDAAVGARAGDPFPFIWGGQQFAAEPLLAMDIEIQLALIDRIEKLNDGDVDPAELLTLIKMIVGEDLLERMRQARPVGGAALMTLLQQWIAHQGGALGKSSASSASSASTAPRSKPTSRSGRGRKTS